MYLELGHNGFSFCVSTAVAATVRPASAIQVVFHALPHFLSQRQHFLVGNCFGFLRVCIRVTGDVVKPKDLRVLFGNFAALSSVRRFKANWLRKKLRVALVR